MAGRCSSATTAADVHLDGRGFCQVSLHLVRKTNHGSLLCSVLERICVPQSKQGKECLLRSFRSLRPLLNSMLCFSQLLLLLLSPLLGCSTPLTPALRPT